MTNSKLLREYINRSGLKRTFVAKKLGLSYQGYLNKESGKSEFTQSEIQDLCDLLLITARDKERIFFAKEVDYMSTT
ncbi:MAG: helix-turn-helix domain-containing protein [Lachnospiraceae bacterium]|nr:helix-turn-helix domain-containing protein [Lachnospiraceae bacterium]